MHVTQCWTDDTPDRILRHYPAVCPDVPHTGQRSSANQFRMFVTRSHTPEIAGLFENFNTNESRDYFTDLTGVDCSAGLLRIELCQDSPGFWLQNHVDIPEKLITLQIYLGAGRRGWGTKLLWPTGDITVPFEHNTGWLSHQNARVLHGVPEKTVDGVRKSVIINYVSGDWADVDQLY